MVESFRSQGAGKSADHGGAEWRGLKQFSPRARIPTQLGPDYAEGSALGTVRASFVAPLTTLPVGIPSPCPAQESVKARCSTMDRVL